MSDYKSPFTFDKEYHKDNTTWSRVRTIPFESGNHENETLRNTILSLSRKVISLGEEIEKYKNFVSKMTDELESYKQIAKEHVERIKKIEEMIRTMEIENNL